MQNLKVKTLVLILLGVMVVGGLGYGGYRLWNKEKPKENGNTNQSTQSAMITDLGNGWKEYKNEQLGFSINYPTSWKEPQEDPYEENVVFKNLDPKDYPIENYQYTIPESYRSLGILRYSQKKITGPVSDYYEQIKAGKRFSAADELEVSKIEIHGYSAVKEVTKYENKYWVTLYFINDTKTVIYGINLSFKDTEGRPLQPEVEQMMNTFTIL